MRRFIQELIKYELGLYRCQKPALLEKQSGLLIL